MRAVTGLGSTETGTIRHFIIPSQTQLQGKVVPIGYPVDGMEIALVDDTGHSVGPSQVGEITVRSKYNALGYWNQPDATRRVFVPDPADPTITSYRTGDMGYLNPDGLLEHRGRKDFQVKVRGFRVEVAEIEAALMDHPNVAETVVTALEIDDEDHLIAYVVPRAGGQVALRPLISFLRARLPYYMIPTMFVGLAAVPRTPNNKVDRKALPRPTAWNQIRDDDIVEGTTETERQLVVICQELLRKRRVGVNENFFDLGGHSLSATQLVSRILDRFRVRVSMRTVFETENLAALARLIETSAPSQAGDESILVPASREDRIPLSFAQRRMWILDQFFPGTAAYNISNCVRLDGRLDVVALERALNEVVRRHEILRTVFPSDEEGPRQLIRPHQDLPLRQVGLLHLSREEQDTRTRVLLDDDARRPFDLENGPLFRPALLRLNDEASILILIFSHIIYDNVWSSGIFFRELSSLYDTFTRGVASVVPDLPLQFADYASWQQRVSSNWSVDEHLAYWKRQLADLPPPLQVPADHARPQVPTFRGALVTFHVPTTVKAALADLARQESATMFMVLVSAWQLLLHRYTQQDDILVGTPTGRRERIETEEMIGLFINTLVLRANCSGNPSFRSLLRQVRRTTIDAFAHDQLPFEDLVAELKPSREPGVAPLFQHLFIHRKAADTPWTIPGLTVTSLEVHSGGAKFDLTLSILEEENHLKGTIEYSTDLFAAESIARMAGSFRTLLASIAKDADCALWDLELLSESERSEVTRKWNETVGSYPDVCSHELVERRASQRPDAVAVMYEGRSLTYRELNGRANQLASYLKSLGVGPEVLVGLCVERSPDLVIGLLGILKAGGAYVPLDPSLPAERLSFMIEDSNAPVIVIERAIAGRFAGSGAKTVLLDDDSNSINSQPDANLPVDVEPSNLAYVIYTSGSSGRPKGVQLTHQALVNFLSSMQREPGLSERDVFHAVTTISFDIAALEIFLPLVTGARVVIASRGTAADPELLMESLRTSNTSVMQATPVTWRMLLDHGMAGHG